MQQSYAKLSGLKVAVKTSDVVEDALRMNSAALTRTRCRWCANFGMTQHHRG